MVHIAIPEDLFESLKNTAPASMPAEDYVVELLREKRATKEQQKEFYRLSDRTKSAMAQKGITEEDILNDFESFRKELSPDG
jgi:hypothetical protein